LRDWNTTEAIFAVIDRLLFVFMLIEILHTIQTSIRSRTLTCEPFLIVALIASIRRVLVITLQSSEFTRDAAWTSEHEAHFHATMIELVVLRVLILVMVASIRMLRRGRGGGDAEPGQPT
jgi:phosphate starvation-inducible membrane PsiE